MPDRIVGTSSLAQIESAIQFKEGKSFEFQGSQIENGKDNLVDFKELPIGTSPNDFRLTAAADPPPDGFEALPNSPFPMMVKGKKTDVKAWRKK